MIDYKRENAVKMKSCIILGFNEEEILSMLNMIKNDTGDVGLPLVNVLIERVSGKWTKEDL